MPTYEYKCGACGNEFEKYQSITSSPIRKCPKCGKSRVKRLIGTGAGVIFKGAGFYQTDYRSESYKTGAKNDGGGGETAKTGGESKPATETAKPAAAAAGSTETPAPAKPADPKPEPASKRKSAK
ncbi:MAG: FmdB family zinc ribbon protein [Tepidisphaeraceae bacterium]|jgi:putative FmdB family regulatory protein